MNAADWNKRWVGEAVAKLKTQSVSQEEVQAGGRAIWMFFHTEHSLDKIASSTKRVFPSLSKVKIRKLISDGVGAEAISERGKRLGKKHAKKAGVKLGGREPDRLRKLEEDSLRHFETL